MKSNAQIVWVNDNPLEFDNGKKCYETKFCDEDGVVGTVYVMDKKPTVGSQVKIALDPDKSEKVKFKISR